MFIKTNLRKLLPHILVGVIFLILSFVYTYPILQNKVLFMYDMFQAEAGSKELHKYYDSTGESPLWTNSQFGGMPHFSQRGLHINSITNYISAVISFTLPTPVNTIFLLLVSMYIALAALGTRAWIAALGALGYTFASFHLISIEAGHISKVLGIAYAPPIIAGVILIFSGRFKSGVLLSALFGMLELYANHVQITYYLFLALVIIVLYYGYLAVKNAAYAQYLKGLLILTLIGGITLGSYFTKYWTNYEYAKFTMRGKSELSSHNKSGGLDKDYAFRWSYGITETFTFLVPDYYGGASSTSLTNKSNTYKTLINNGIPTNSAKGFVENIAGYGGSLYFGEQPMTGGPAYMGAFICFLFVLGMFIINNKLKWIALTIVVFFTILSWGSNIFISDIMFDFFPLYNKFRAVTMIHSMVSAVMCLFAAWTLKYIFDSDNSDIEKQKLWIKRLTISFGILLLFFILFGTSLRSFERISSVGQTMSPDESFKSVLKQVTQSNALAIEIYNAFIQDRISAFRFDSVRSLIIILLGAGILWFYKLRMLKYVPAAVSLILLVFVDHWFVSKRYLNKDDFINERELVERRLPSKVDQQILSKGNKEYYRVMNVAVSTFNDATPSFYHKSIGGYSAIKMQRFQDIIDRYISNMNMPVLNMLNTRFIIGKNDQGNLIVQENFDAMGNAWFVDGFKFVKNPDEEIDALKEIDPAQTAIVDVEFSSLLGNKTFTKDTTGHIALIKYNPDYMIYDSEASSPQLAVFSDIYYKNVLGWQAYIDGNPVDHFRVNYILRGLIVPEGKHKIEFIFKPQAFFTAEYVSFAFSMLFFMGLIGILFVKRKDD